VTHTSAQACEKVVRRLSCPILEARDAIIAQSTATTTTTPTTSAIAPLLSPTGSITTSSSGSDGGGGGVVVVVVVFSGKPPLLVAAVSQSPQASAHAARTSFSVVDYGKQGQVEVLVLQL
jgi:hypothetical protein